MKQMNPPEFAGILFTRVCKHIEKHVTNLCIYRLQKEGCFLS